MAEKPKTQNQKRDDEILDLGSVELGQIKYHLGNVRYFSDTISKKVKDYPDLVADAVNSKRVIDELLIKLGKFIEQTEKRELASQKNRTLGQLIDESTDAVEFMEYLNNAILALGSKETEDGFTVKLACESLGILMMCGIHAIQNQQNREVNHD